MEGTPGHCSPRSQRGGWLLGVCGPGSVSVAAILRRCGAPVGCGHRSALPVATPGLLLAVLTGRGVLWVEPWLAGAGGQGAGPRACSTWCLAPTALPAACSRPQRSLPPLPVCPLTLGPRGATPMGQDPHLVLQGHRVGTELHAGPRGAGRSGSTHLPGSWQRRAQAGPPWGQGLRSHGDMGLPSPDRSPECGAGWWSCG